MRERKRKKRKIEKKEGGKEGEERECQLGKIERKRSVVWQKRE